MGLMVLFVKEFYIYSSRFLNSSYPNYDIYPEFIEKNTVKGGIFNL
jgi:hypothetical protein